MIRRKAQIQQVFIYLMAMLVIGFLVLFGYRMIDKLLDQQCDVQTQTFITGLERDLDRATRFGSVTESVLNAPCDAQKICIVDKKMFKSEALPQAYKDTHPIAWANTQGDVKVRYNIYLYEQGPIGTPLLYDDRITTQKERMGDPLMCVEAHNGQFAFLMEGLGKNGIYAYNET